MTDYFKYPRTPHFPWSPGGDDEDTTLDSVDQFEGKRIIVTEKMDGENTSMYNDHIHARSIDSKDHPSRAYVKQLWGNIKHDIPEGWRICGENMYAEHSISYKNLSSYFLGFSIWNDQNQCLSWDDTMYWFGLMDISSVPILYDGIWDQATITRIEQGLMSVLSPTTHEGYVVRIADTIEYKDFNRYFGKYVRKNHVQTDEHWMFKEVVPNKLRE